MFPPEDLDRLVMSPEAEAAINTLVKEQLLTKHIFQTHEGSVEMVQLDSRVCILNVTYTSEGEKSNG